MPWKEVTALSERTDFVSLCLQPGSNISELCRRFNVSRKTGYKWLHRFEQEGPDGLKDRPRRPASSPFKTAPDVEEDVIEVRKEHRAWGGRKIRRRLENLGSARVPAASTVTQILRRNDLLDSEESLKHKACQRFEHAACNDLWQMDFKGPVATDAGKCHPLTVLDDHSRFSVLLEACWNEKGETVKDRLARAFERFGLPIRILTDNGPPWSAGPDHPFTALTVWLMRLGIGVCHGRPYHPQTQGKDERFHGTLQAELLRYRRFRDIAECQAEMDRWRIVYNHQRPHESIDMDVPGSRYVASKRTYPGVLPPIEYGPDDAVRKVQHDGRISFKGCEYYVGRAFFGYPVAVRPTVTDDVFAVYFCHQKVTQIDLANRQLGGHQV